MSVLAGVTPSERYLGQLCQRSFLRLWSHQNLFTDRGFNEAGEGKELCDLLVVFDNDVIIFSDKSCQFPNTGDVWLDWSRWYRKAIAKSADQVFGAERWIAEHSSRIFTNRQCTERFPFPIPLPASARIHRVIVALGSKARAEDYFGGNSRGSLMLASWLQGNDHLTKGEMRRPFAVGQVNPQKGFVHVFDDITLDIVLSELDTITDFVQYLTMKEWLFKQVKYLSCAGEEDLLGFYLANLDEKGNFSHSGVDAAIADPSMAVFVTEGIWDQYCASDKAEFHRELRKNGEFIDHLIEVMTTHALAGTLAYGGEDGIAGQERNLRFLASEPRLSRALLAMGMMQKMATTPNNVRTSIVMESHWPDRVYVFLLFPRGAREAHKAYRSERQAALTAYCYVVRHMKPELRYVIGFTTEPGSSSRRRSEDLMSFDFADWTAEDDENAIQAQKEMNILTDYSHRSLLFGEPVTRRGDLRGGNRRERRKAKALARRYTSPRSS